MTTQIAANSLGVSTARVRKLLATGKLLGHKHGRDWQVNAASVDDYRDSRLPTFTEETHPELCALITQANKETQTP
jgi:excisionase family DNA binding protein